MKLKYIISLSILLILLSCSKSKDSSTPNLVNYGTLSPLIGKTYADVTIGIQGKVLSKEATIIKTEVLINAEVVPINYEFKNNLLDKITITTRTADASDLLIKIFNDLYGSTDYKIHTSDLTSPLVLDQTTYEQNFRSKTYLTHPVNYSEAIWQQSGYTITATYISSLIIQITANSTVPVA